MRKIIVLSFCFLTTLSFVFAQAYPYFSFRKVPGGIMIGVETINQKTKSVLGVKGYTYEWTFSDISLIKRTSNSNLFFLPLQRIPASFNINLKIFKSLTKESYNFEKEAVLPLPRVKIVRKQGNFILPLEAGVGKTDYLTFNLENFSSKSLQIIWEFNGVFVSNEREIPVYLLKEKNGTIEVRVYGRLGNELAADSNIIKIE